MTGRLRERRGHWVQALAMSLALHGVAAAAIMDVLPALPARAPVPWPLPEIEITSLPLDRGVAAPVALQPADPVTLSGVDPVTVQPAPTPGLTDRAVIPAQPVLTPADDMLQATANTHPERRPGATLQPSQGDSPPPDRPADMPADTRIAALPAGGDTPSSRAGDQAAASPAQTGALADLVAQLRDRLEQPCLATLPQTLGTDEVLLTTFGASDRAISDLFRDLSGTVDLPMTERSVLLDARQCPAVDFIRAIPSYPALGLQVRLNAAEVGSGERLVGQVAGIDGNQPSLLLVDDNGVVQDLRRFTLQSGDLLQFDVPVHRVGANRDTNQLLIALATPTRPESIANLQGRLAEDFFLALGQATGGQVLVGIAPVYVRAER